MRLMSFAATTDQMRAGTKTVTRRIDSKEWYLRTLKVGDLVLACAKTRNVRREDRDALGVIEIVDVRREPIDALEDSHYYRAGEGYRDVVREGFPEMGVPEFINFFADLNRCNPLVDVTRIEFRHRKDLTVCCGAPREVWPPGGDDGTTRYYRCSSCQEAV